VKLAKKEAKPAAPKEPKAEKKTEKKAATKKEDKPAKVCLIHARVPSRSSTDTVVEDGNKARTQESCYHHYEEDSNGKGTS